MGKGRLNIVSVEEIDAAWELAEKMWNAMRAFNKAIQTAFPPNSFLAGLVFDYWSQTDRGGQQEFCHLAMFNLMNRKQWTAETRHLQARVIKMSCGWTVEDEFSSERLTDPYLARWEDLPPEVRLWNKAKDRHYKKIFEKETGIFLAKPGPDCIFNEKKYNHDWDKRFEKGEFQP